MSSEEKIETVSQPSSKPAFPERVQPWFWLMVQISGWLGLIYDLLRRPQDVSWPLAVIFAGMVCGARGIQLVLERGRGA